MGAKVGSSPPLPGKVGAIVGSDNVGSSTGDGLMLGAGGFAFHALLMTFGGSVQSGKRLIPPLPPRGPP